MNPSILWQRGDRALGYQVERILNAGAEGEKDREVLRDNPRRRIVALRVGSRRVVVKHFRVGSGRHEIRDRWKSAVGFAPAKREWKALRAMHRAGLPVPEAWVLGTLADGDHVLVMEHLAGTPLDVALRRDALDPRQGLAELGAWVAKIHAAGWIHGDLHVGNLLHDPERADPWGFVDWQHARRSRSIAEQRADLARLEYSLSRFLPLSQRMRLREAALRVERPYDAVARAAVRQAGNALWDRLDEHAESRTRRALRPGRQVYAVSMPGRSGLRTGDLSDADVARILDAHDDAQTRRDDPRRIKTDSRSAVSAVALGERRLIVKEFPRRGIAKWLLDRVRGSAAWRAWKAAHGLRARRIGVAQPFAYLEEGRTRPRSWIVLEDLRPATEACFAVERGLLDPEPLANLLLDLVLALHRRGVDHGDLKGTHILLCRSTRGGQGRLEARLIDLEGVRFRRRVPWWRRRRALIQLNASMPDSVPAATRRRFLARYLQIFPVRDSAAAERSIVERSLARNHRWSGSDCSLGSGAARPRAPETQR